MRCPHCATVIERQFCAACGEQRPVRMQMRSIIHDLVRHVADWDAIWLRTINALTLQPGDTCRAYFSGDRRSLVNPLKYAFIMATMYSLLVLLFDIDLRPESVRRTAEATEAFRLVFASLGYLALFYLLPVAWIQARVFRQEGYNTAECYTSLLYLYGQVTLLLILLLPLNIFGIKADAVVRQLLFLVYLVYWNRRLYQASWTRELPRSLVVFMCHLVFSVLAGIMLVAFTTGLATRL